MNKNYKKPEIKLEVARVNSMLQAVSGPGASTDPATKTDPVLSKERNDDSGPSSYGNLW